MSAPLAAAPRGFSRRTLLAASAAGLAVLATGCTSSSSADEREKVTGRQADELGAQVAVQEGVVAAFVAAGAADPALAGEVADLAAQAGDQLARLRAAAPGSSTSAPPGDVAPAAPETRAWLRAQVAAASSSHAAASVGQSGARAALLGSIAAGLAGQDGRLA